MKIEYVILDESIAFEAVQGFVSLLPKERQGKIARYRFEQDKLLSLAAGLLIRRAVGDSPLYSGSHGKLYAENGIFFSVSHSGRIAAIAVDDREIGLDVEQLRDEKQLKIADRFYHPAERAYVVASKDPCRAFCEIWTRKEAYLKMTGEGISADLTAFDTTAEPLRKLLFTTAVGDYCLSVCAAAPIGDREIHISEIELKDLLY